MKVHQLINVLNHLPPDAEVDIAPEVVTAEDGQKFSVSKTLDTFKDGEQGSAVVHDAPAGAAGSAGGTSTTGAGSAGT